MADPLSITLGAVSVVQTCVNLTKIIVATKKALANITSEAEDIVKELSGLKLVCVSVQHVCEKAKEYYESPALPISDATRLKELCGRLALSMEDCKLYMNQLERLFVGVFGTSDNMWNRRSIVRSAVRQFLKKDKFQEIRSNISIYRANIQNHISCLNSFYQFESVQCSKQSLKIMNTMSASICSIQTSMQSFHELIDKYLQPTAQSRF